MRHPKKFRQVKDMHISCPFLHEKSKMCTKMLCLNKKKIIKFEIWKWVFSHTIWGKKGHITLLNLKTLSIYTSLYPTMTRESQNSHMTFNPMKLSRPKWPCQLGLRSTRYDYELQPPWICQVLKDYDIGLSSTEKLTTFFGRKISVLLEL